MSSLPAPTGVNFRLVALPPAGDLVAGGALPRELARANAATTASSARQARPTRSG